MTRQELRWWAGLLVNNLSIYPAAGIAIIQALNDLDKAEAALESLRREQHVFRPSEDGQLSAEEQKRIIDDVVDGMLGDKPSFDPIPGGNPLPGTGGE